MAIPVLALLEAIRWRLDDVGGDTGPPSLGFYARWQESDAGCLWKNSELVLYLTQTVRELSGRLPWKAGPDRELALLAGVRQYPLDADIVQVASVTRASDGQPLVKTTVAEMEAVSRWHRHQRECLALDWRAEIGAPTHYVLDEQQEVLSVYPRPGAGPLERLRLSVWAAWPDPPAWAVLRAESTPLRTLERIPEALEEALVAGVCARAYRKHDADTHNAALVAQYEAEFTLRVGPPMSQQRLRTEGCWADTPLPVEPNTFFAR